MRVRWSMERGVPENRRVHPVTQLPCQPQGTDLQGRATSSECPPGHSACPLGRLLTARRLNSCHFFKERAALRGFLGTTTDHDVAPKLIVYLERLDCGYDSADIAVIRDDEVRRVYACNASRCEGSD